MPELTQEINNYINVGIFIMTAIVLFITIKSFTAKIGASFRYSFIYSYNYLGDIYITRLYLENLKDRSVVIFKIYLKLSWNYYIEIEDFSEQPLILKPYELYHKNYDPIIYYTINLNRITINKVFNKTKKPPLILATNFGKIKVNQYINRWDPLIEFFKNYFTAIITPKRAMFDDKCYDSNIRYIVKFHYENSEISTIQIRKDEFEFNKFKYLKFTKDIIESKKKLQSYLNICRKKGILKFKKVEIIEYENWINEEFRLGSIKTIEAEKFSFFNYFILGRISNIIENRNLKKKNRKK